MFPIVNRYSSITLITAPKIHVELLWSLSIVFLILGLLYFVGVFFFRNKLSFKSKTIQEKKKYLSPIISEFLFFEENSSKDEKTKYIELKIEIRQFLNDSFNRKILSEVLLDLCKDVSGKTQESLFALYTELDLHRDAYKKIKSWRWQLVSSGIYELKQMYVIEAYSIITKFINDKRSTVRKQAEIATVTLKKEGIIHFLDTTKYKISEWQQLKLLEVLRNKKDFQPPKFKQWLTSSNKYVVLFSLRLIEYYNQNDAELSIVELVKHENIEVKQAAINCIKEFSFYKASKILKLVFWNSSTDIKISILGALAVIGKQEDLPFIEQIENKEANFSVRSKALSTINAIIPESILPTQNIETNIQHNIPENISESVIEKTKPLASTMSKENFKNPSRENKPIDSEVINDELQAIREKELHSYLMENEISNEEVLNLDFLPIISSDNIQKLDSTENSSSKESVKDIEVNSEQVIGKRVNDMEVSFEEITISEIAKEERSFDLNFIPIITKITKKPSPDLDSFYKEVPDIILDKYFLKSIEEEVDMGFVPLIYDSKNSSEEIPNTIDDIDPIKLREYEVVFEEVKENLPKINLSDEISNERDLEVISSTIYLDSLVEKTEGMSLFNSIPKPLFYKEEELQMLENIENINAFGDGREIPLLQEFLEHSKDDFIKEQILETLKKMHKKTSINEASDIKIKKEKFISEINLIEELFNNSDSESKLILLDEIVAIGDKKELKILNKLLSDSDDAVREKTLISIAKLQYQINLKEKKIADLVSLKETEEASPIPLEFAFLKDYKKEFSDKDIETSIVKNDTKNGTVTKKITDQNSFLEQFYTFTSKLLDKLNG